jgi:hypothetical protein
MQTVRELNPQQMCSRLLTVDSQILYSSYLDSEGKRLAEATNDMIELFAVLTVILLPLRGDRGSLVLAAPVGSDLREIVTKAKKILADET